MTNRPTTTVGALPPYGLQHASVVPDETAAGRRRFNAGAVLSQGAVALRSGGSSSLAGTGNRMNTVRVQRLAPQGYRIAGDHGADVEGDCSTNTQRHQPTFTIVVNRTNLPVNLEEPLWMTTSEAWDVLVAAEDRCVRRQGWAAWWSAPSS